jgi:signal transduction histidine kinase
MARPVPDEIAPALAEHAQPSGRAVGRLGSQVGVADVGRWIVTTAAELTGARYAAFEILSPAHDGQPSQLITLAATDDGRCEKLDTADSKSLLRVPILVRGEVYGVVHLTDERDGEFTDPDKQMVGALATAAGFAIQNAQFYEEVTRRQQWLEASRDIMAMLLSGSQPTEVFPTLIACVRALAGADSAFLTLPVGDGTVRAEVADGLGAERIRGMILPEESMSARAMGDEHPTSVADARQDDRIWQRVIEAAGAGPALFVPMGSATAVVGTLVVTNRRGGAAFSQETAMLLESIAAQAALALRLGAAATDREQLAVLGDRDRIARDLHDLVIQRLFATGLSLTGALRGMQPEPAVIRVQQAVDDLDSTIKEIRTSIFALQAPAPMSGDGLRAGIRHAVRGASNALGFDPTLILDGPIDFLVPQTVGEQMLAVLRESVSNATQHSEATALTVKVTVTVDEVCLVVQDNGVGLSAADRRSGLANLARRATDLGGTFEAEAVSDPVGTRVQWRVPLGLAT